MFGDHPTPSSDPAAAAQIHASQRRGRSDFRHVDTWIFDLDNTLYPATANLFDQIEARMNLFVQRQFGVDAGQANHLRKTYFRDHGTTLSGLMKLHGLDPEPFLAFVHDIDLSALEPDASLISGLDRLPGKRFVFTNGCQHHALRIMNRLGIAGHFHDLWDIRTIGYLPKPARAAYQTVIDRGKFAPRSAAMFDDTKRNLVPAQEIGFTTVWLKTKLAALGHGPQLPLVEPHHIHYETDDLVAFLHSLEIGPRS